MQRQLIVILFILFTASVLEAKCGNSFIYVDGIVTGTVGNATVSVQVSPDPNWEPQPAISIGNDGKFQAKVYFDRTKSEGKFHQNCSRQPDTVTVQLLREGRTVDQVQLTIDHDFLKKDRFDYETRSPVDLHSN